jgi:hypothetical protein
MVKPLEEYTDKELEKSIKVHETQIAEDKKTKFKNEDLMDAIKTKEDFLKKLHEERDRRRKKP